MGDKVVMTSGCVTMTSLCHASLNMSMLSGFRERVVKKKLSS